MCVMGMYRAQLEVMEAERAAEGDRNSGCGIFESPAALKEKVWMQCPASQDHHSSSTSPHNALVLILLLLCVMCCVAVWRDRSSS